MFTYLTLQQFRLRPRRSAKNVRRFNNSQWLQYSRLLKIQLRCCKYQKQAYQKLYIFFKGRCTNCLSGCNRMGWNVKGF